MSVPFPVFVSPAAPARLAERVVFPVAEIEMALNELELTVSVLFPPIVTSGRLMVSVPTMRSAPSVVERLAAAGVALSKNTLELAVRLPPNFVALPSMREAKFWPAQLSLACPVQ